MTYSKYFATTVAVSSASLVLSLVAGTLFLVFNFKRYRHSSASIAFPSSIPRSVPLDSGFWLLIAFMATNTWLIIWLLAIYLTPSHGAYYGRIDNYASTQLTIFRILLSPAVFSAVLVVQLRLTLALRRASGLPDARDRLDRILGPDAVPIPGPAARAGSALILPLGLGARLPHNAERLVADIACSLSLFRFVAMQLFIHRRSYYSVGHMPLTVYLMDGAVAVFLLGAALTSFGYAAAIDPKTPPLRNILRLILTMSTLTIIRQVYELIYALLFSLPPQMHTVVNSPLWLPVATSIFSPFTTAICLALAAAALRQDLGSLWELFTNWDPKELGTKPTSGQLLHPRRRDADSIPSQKDCEIPLSFDGP